MCANVLLQLLLHSFTLYTFVYLNLNQKEQLFGLLKQNHTITHILYLCVNQTLPHARYFIFK